VSKRGMSPGPKSSATKRRRSRWVLVAIAAVLGSAFVVTNAILAASVRADVPAGINCVGADGQILGLGTSSGDGAQALLWNGFDADVCGNTPGPSNSLTGNDMGVYNPGATSTTAIESLEGLVVANCRSAAYGGTDIPYDVADLVGLDGAPGSAAVGGCPPLPALGQFPDPNASGDEQAALMSFPIGGYSVALEINLTAADCGGTNPNPIDLTAAQVSAIFGGSTLVWNDPSLVVNNPALAGCNIPITRVVRYDDAESTTILRNYLVRVDDSRSSATCDTPYTTPIYIGSYYTVATTWSSFPNTIWPGGPDTGAPGYSSPCSLVVDPGTNGGPALLGLLKRISGGIGYADLPDVMNDGSGLLSASVQNAAATTYSSPLSGRTANCDFTALTLPGFSSSDAVGLNLQDNWAADNAEVNGPSYGSVDHEDATDLGSRYPICGLAFDLVFSGLSAGPDSAIASLTGDQRRTLYSFMTYVLSSTAQDELGGNYYAPLPAAWLETLQDGFQTNY